MTPLLEPPRTKAECLKRLEEARLSWHASFDAGDLDTSDEALASLDGLLEYLHTLWPQPEETP